MGSNPVAVTSPSDFAPASSKEFLDIQATIECGFTLKRVRDMIKTYSLVIELGGKFEGAEDFFNTRLKELYSDHGMSEEELRLCVYLFMLRIQFSLVHSLE